MIQENTGNMEKQHTKSVPKRMSRSLFWPPLSFYPPSFFVKKMLQWAEKNKIRNNNNKKRTHDATRSGVSASMDNKAVCTLSNQLSSRSRKDLICGIPKTLGCTQETCTVPST